MDKLVKRVWWIVIPTALAVLGFQLYWLRTTYMSQQLSFTQVATDALQRAYETSTLGSAGKRHGAADTANASSPVTIHSEVMVSSATTKLNGDSILNAQNLPKQLQSLKPEMLQKIVDQRPPAFTSVGDTNMTIRVDMDKMSVDLSKLISGIVTFTDILAIDTATLRKNFHLELARRQIDLPFRLSVYRKDTTLPKGPGNVVIKTATMKQPVVVAAQFPGIGWLLFGKMIWPVLLSFLLIVLIAGCIWILWRTVLRQKKLDEMKNDFISNITHELKTPVAILRATNEALLTFGGINDAEKTARYLRLEHAELRKLQGLVDNIMLLTRMEHGKSPEEPAATMQVSRLLKNVADRFADLPDVHINIEATVANDELYAQPAALSTILSNLVDNAIKYTLTSPKHVTLAVTELNGEYHFTVKDAGIGIDKAHIPFLFDKFYRVPHGDLHDVKGYGLGLSHVKTLVDKMGGAISVDSQPGNGTTFIIQLKKHERENKPAFSGR